MIITMLVGLPQPKGLRVQRVKEDGDWGAQPERNLDLKELNSTLDPTC